MDDVEPTNDASAEEPAYRYHRWHTTLIRERGILDAEYLGPDGWDSSPYAIDALTGRVHSPIVSACRAERSGPAISVILANRPVP